MSRNIALATLLETIVKLIQRYTAFKMHRSSARYSKLKGETVSFRKRDDEFDDEQFEETTPAKFPLRSILTAMFLFTVGTIFLTLGLLVKTGYIGHPDPNSNSSSIPLLVIGIISFLPGFYSVRLAYLAWMGYPGYSYADIPTDD